MIFLLSVTVQQLQLMTSLNVIFVPKISLERWWARLILIAMDSSPFCKKPIVSWSVKLDVILVISWMADAGPIRGGRYWIVLETIFDWLIMEGFWSTIFDWLMLDCLKKQKTADSWEWFSYLEILSWCLTGWYIHGGVIFVDIFEVTLG